MQRVCNPGPRLRHHTTRIAARTPDPGEIRGGGGWISVVIMEFLITGTEQRDNRFKLMKHEKLYLNGKLCTSFPEHKKQNHCRHTRP
jgi:hypothetical protein